MRRRRPLLAACLAALLAGPALGASLEEAWSLYGRGELDAAAAALSDLLAAGDPAERAEALNLAGTVAAARGDLPGARRLWSEAAERYADAPAGREAAAKLDLLCALTACEGQAPVAPAAPAPPVAPATPASTPTAAPAAPAAPLAAPPAASSRVAPREGTIVLVAGQGEPYDAVVDATQYLTEFLRSQGVDARSPTQEIAVVQRSEVVVGQLLDAARDHGAASVVVIDARFGHRERVQVTCWNADGAVLWSESVTGGTSFSRPVMNRNLMERLTGKLGARVAGPGLPTSL
jgi:hypothetical protein